ncbi:M48 family metallopeptidase [Piscinibacter sakaiensis]|uniref:M48 family metallopeptidase n=1 Tax=Piscinibacter sakaiensis TaxID=1547922 RepID=UPI003AAD2149
MQIHHLTWLFVLALVASFLGRCWLASRQIRHVARHRNEVPAAFADSVSLAAHQKAADYSIEKLRLGLLSAAVGSAVLLGWTLLGGLELLNGLLLESVQPLLPGAWGDMAYQLSLLLAFVVIGGLIELPFELYSTFGIEQRFGFNRMSWRMYLADSVKSAAVGMLIGLPIAALILWLMGAAGAMWWLWAWAAWVGFNLLILVLYPTVIAPLFNRFEPLADESLKSRVQALMQRCGFAAKGLFVMDGSRRSAHANAYFTGLGAAKRVVFFDTLLSKLTPGEVEAVLAHELGHFKHKHVRNRIIMMFGFSLAGFALLGWCSSQLAFYASLGVRPSPAAPNDALALLLFLLVIPVFGFFFSPLLAGLSRRDEFQADAYACAQADGSALASALLKLHEDNATTLTPDPVYARFYYSHPPAVERLAALPAARPAGANAAGLASAGA